MTGRHASVQGAAGRPDGAAPSVAPLVARDVSFVRGGRTIVDAVSVTVRPGRSLAVVGPSGSGKSSLLAILAGLQPADSGTVTGHDQRLGLVLQGYGLVSVLTAAENVEVALVAGGRAPADAVEIERRAAEALRDVGLDHVSDHLIEELSGGQQQRVAIARALAIEADVVLADEPSAELDHGWKNRILDGVLDVARRGGVVVVATHDPELAARCDEVIRMVDGRVVAAVDP